MINKPTSASFIVTEKCNLACKYCFINKDRECCKNMNAEVAVAGIEYLYKNAEEQNIKNVSVILFGGEPLLNIDTCEIILSNGLRLQKETGIKFEVNLITNGTVMNKEIEYVLYKYAALINNFTCQLSIDGNKEAHDLYRVFTNGNGSFDSIEKNVETFKSIFKDRLSIHGCLNKKTLPLLYDSYKFIADIWKVNHIWFMPVHSEDWDESDVAEYDKQLGLIFSDMKERNSMSIFAPVDRCLGGNDKHPNKTCGAGNSFMSFTGNGDIYPCHNIYFNDPEHSQKCGNVFDKELDEDILKPYIEYSYVTMGCGDCENTKCYRCIADNWTYNGDITKQIGKPYRCALSAIERKYQIMARGYAENHYVPNDLKEARVHKEMMNKIENLEKAVGLLLEDKLSEKYIRRKRRR